ARPPSAAIFWCVFMGWAILSAMWAIEPGLVFERLTSKVGIFCLYIMAVSIRPSRKELYLVCRLLLLGEAVTAVWGYLFGLDPTAHAGRARILVGDFDTNPATLGATMILPLALAIAGFIGTRNHVQKIVAATGIVLTGMAIIISGSRAPLLAMIIMVAVLLYRMRARWQIIATAALLFTVVAVAPDTFYGRVESTLAGEDATGAGRTDIWNVGLESLGRFWVLGAG